MTVGASGVASYDAARHAYYGPVPQKTIKSDANGNGISDASLRRAKTKLGVKAHKDGMEGAWFWQLPSAEDAQIEESLSTFEDAQEGTKVLSQKSLSAFGNLDHLRADCRTRTPASTRRKLRGQRRLARISPPTFRCPTRSN
jgi:hypothetical protein